jgi:hypothetical protein
MGDVEIVGLSAYQNYKIYAKEVEEKGEIFAITTTRITNS